jgi:WD40 repeat protein
VTIMIWDATKNPPERICKPLARQHQYCIHALSFNTSGNLLITLGGDSKYTSRVIIYEWAKVGRGAPGEVVGKEELGILPLRDGPCIIPGGGQRSFVIANNPYTTEVELTPEVVAAQGALYGERTEEGEQEWPRRETDKRFNFVQTVDKASKMWDLGKAFETPTRAARTMTGITTPQKGLAGAWCPPSWFPKEGRPLDPVAAVGLQLGDIYLFQLVGSEITVTHKIEMAHRGEVLCLKFVIKTAPGPGEPGEQFLFSGGRDGKVKGWDPKISWADPCMEFDLTRIVEDGIENKVAVRALDYNPLRRTLVVGTSVNSIFEIDIVKLAQGQPGPCRCLVSAHFAAVTGVAAVPRPLAKSGRGGVGVGGDKGGAGRVVEDFVTVGLDGSLRWWSCEQRAETRCRIFALPAQCVDVSADGRLAAVGHAGGQWSVWETTRMQCIYVNRHASADVTLLKFSPDSLVLSVVSNRREVRLYDCTRYAPRAPAGQEEEFYGDGNIKGREKALLKERIAFMQAHKGNEDRKAPKALVKVGRRLNPEKPARHFMRPPPTSGIVDKIGLEVKGAGAAMLPSFKELAVSAPTHAGLALAPRPSSPDSPHPSPLTPHPC